ncbi:hypothetical protein [Pseudomonas sp. TE50-2]
MNSETEPREVQPPAPTEADDEEPEVLPDDPDIEGLPGETRQPA